MAVSEARHFPRRQRKPVRRYLPFRPLRHYHILARRRTVTHVAAWKSLEAELILIVMLVVMKYNG